MKLTMKNLFMGALLTTSVAQAGPFDAAEYAGNEVKVGVAHVADFGKGIITNTGGLVALYNETKDTYTVIGRGNAIKNLYLALVKLPLNGAEAYVGIKSGFDSGVVVLAGQTVNWAVRLLLKTPAVAIQEVPYVGDFAVDLTDKAAAFSKAITSKVSSMGVHLVTGSYGLINDTLNLVEDIVTLDRPFYSSGKYVKELPGKVYRLIGLDYGVKNTVSVSKAVVGGVKKGANAVANAAAAPSTKKKSSFARGPR